MPRGCCQQVAMQGNARLIAQHQAWHLGGEPALPRTPLRANYDAARREGMIAGLERAIVIIDANRSWESRKIRAEIERLRKET